MRIIIIAVVLLVIISFLYRLIGMLMKSIETVAKLPVVNLVNAIAGALAGALEALVIFWIIYIIIDSFPTGQFGEQIKEWTVQSEILIHVYNRNYIAHWIMCLG